MSVLPWDPGYRQPQSDPNLVSTVEKAAQQVAQEIVAPPPPSGPSVAPVGGNDWLTSIEKAASISAEQAFTSALPGVQQRIAAVVKSELLKMFPGTDPSAPVVLDPSVLTQASARSRALRTFFIGLGMTVLWAIISVLGSVSGVDWFSKQGWVSVGTLIVGSVVSSVVSYVARIKIEPSYGLNKKPGS